MSTTAPHPLHDRAERIAAAFHEAYERLAPDHGYETRKASAVPWADVPANNRALMTAVVAELLATGAVAEAAPADAHPYGHRAAVVEILERYQPHHDDPAADGTIGVIVPTEVRLNGTPLAIGPDAPIVHGIGPVDLSINHLAGHGPNEALVTMSVYARRVLIGTAPAEPEPYDEGGTLPAGAGVVRNDTGAAIPVVEAPAGGDR